MGDYPKADFPPLLAPGRHFLSMAEIERLCVGKFVGASREHRARLFEDFSTFVNAITSVELVCEIVTDGSFLTEKELPDDVDVVLVIDHDVSVKLTINQRNVIDLLNEAEYFASIDGTSWTRFHIGNDFFESAIDFFNATRDFGLEHGERWLKGYAVVRVGETDVGLRLYR